MNDLDKLHNIPVYQHITYSELCAMMDQLRNVSIFSRENSLFMQWLERNKGTYEFILLGTQHKDWLEKLHRPLMQNHRYMCIQLIKVLQPDLFQQYLLRPNLNKIKCDSYP